MRRVSVSTGTSWRRSFLAVILVGVLASGLSSLRADQSTEARAVPVAGTARTAESPDAATVVSTYCAGCHNGVMKSPSGVLLDQFDTAKIADQPGLWIRAYRQVQAGTMPPVGARRPDRAGYDAILDSIETALGAGAALPEASSQEIATRLALMLWNTSPDAPLLNDAQGNGLTNAVMLQHQVRRMLADERAAAFVARFFFPWLGLDQLAKADPDKAAFPDYDVSLRDAMARETELFLLSQLREDRDPVELWNADYTFLNEQLARHYGVTGVIGTEFRRVRFAAPERAGLLGQGSVHMVTSRHQPGNGPFTSPAARSVWVRLHFLGAALPRPFPGAQPVRPDLPITPQTRTLPAEPCANCHRNFFPLGYALENFDPIGRWRTQDQIGPVDASGSFVDGASTNGVVELRNVLLQRPDAFRTTITEQLLAYAAEKPVNASRLMPDTLVPARHVLRGMTPVRWSSIIAGVVSAKPVE